MLAGISYVGYREFSDLQFLSWFEDLNVTLVFWGILLLGNFLCMVCLFIVQWVCSLLAILRRSSLDYKTDGVPYFDVFCAVISSAISIYISLS